MYEYSDSIADPFFTSAQAMSNPYSNSKYSQTIQDIPKAIDIIRNDIGQNYDLTNDNFKLGEENFIQINNDNISYFQNNTQNSISWNDIPQFEYSSPMKKKLNLIKSSTKEKIENRFCISKEYSEKNQELSKVRYPVSILYKGKKVAESYIGYSIERAIGNDSEILFSKFIIHGTSTRPIFTFSSLHPQNFFYSSENFFEAFQYFKDLVFNFRIFNEDSPSLKTISPLKFVKIKPLKNEYYSIF